MAHAAADEPRRFRVNARHVEAHHARVLEERSFEAVAYTLRTDAEVRKARRNLRRHQ